MTPGILVGGAIVLALIVAAFIVSMLEGKPKPAPEPVEEEFKPFKLDSFGPGQAGLAARKGTQAAMNKAAVKASVTDDLVETLAELDDVVFVEASETVDQTPEISQPEVIVIDVDNQVDQVLEIVDRLDGQPTFELELRDKLDAPAALPAAWLRVDDYKAPVEAPAPEPAYAFAGGGAAVSDYSPSPSYDSSPSYSSSDSCSSSSDSGSSSSDY